MAERTGWMAVLGVAIAVASGCIGQEKQMPPPPEAPAVAAPGAPEPKLIPAAPPVFEEQPPGEAAPAPAAAVEAAPKGEPVKVEGTATTTTGAKKPGAEPSTAPSPAAAAKPAPTVAGPCGDEDQPPCPLQGWMEKHLQQPFDDDQFAKLAPALERLAKMAPEPSWNTGATGWATIAQAGATAARSGDRDAVQQTCKGCHKAWRSKYKAGFRTRAIE